jgi:hypothetical protein
MVSGAHTLLEIALRTGIIYFLVLIGIRVSGKREVGQMTPFDLTLLLLLSNSVQNAMTGPDTSLTGGAVAAATLLILNDLAAEVAGGTPISPGHRGTAESVGTRWRDYHCTYGASTSPCMRSSAHSRARRRHL